MAVLNLVLNSSYKIWMSIIGLWMSIIGLFNLDCDAVKIAVDDDLTGETGMVAAVA